jgi:hypothetical protein
LLRLGQKKKNLLDSHNWAKKKSLTNKPTHHEKANTHEKKIYS